MSVWSVLVSRTARTTPQAGTWNRIGRPERKRRRKAQRLARRVNRGNR